MKFNSLDWLALVLVIVGGINWGFFRSFKFNLVDSIFGEMSTLSRIIYTLVGLSAVYLVFAASKIASLSRDDGKAVA
jgi:uncharacterized membrane protein YuzA (DUF378 family)